MKKFLMKLSPNSLSKAEIENILAGEIEIIMGLDINRPMAISIHKDKSTTVSFTIDDRFAVTEISNAGIEEQVQNAFAKICTADEINASVLDMQHADLFPQSYIAWDVETTGLSYHTDEMTQIAAAKVVGDEIVEIFSSFINTKKQIPDEVVSLTGITNELLEKEGRPLKSVLAEFKEFCGDELMVAHNGKFFDSNFLAKACEKTNISFTNPRLDSLVMLMPSFGTRMSLTKLVKMYCPDLTLDAHRADNDTIRLAKVVAAVKNGISQTDYNAALY